MTMASRNQDTTADSASSSRLGGVRQRAAGVGDQLGSTVEGSPLAALAAGVVLGAVAGALIPRTGRETEVLGPIGSKIGQAAAEAAKAAREAGKEQLGVLSENKSPMEMLADKAVGALQAAGSAAGSAAASSVTGKQDA
jgi:hypothetical protein